MKLEGLKINFLGDSITEGCGTSGGEHCFVGRIAKEYGAVTRNYGIGGTRIAPQHKPSANPRWDLDFCSRVAEMDPDADLICVFGGTNDFGHGDAPFGTFEDRTAETFCGALHTLFVSLIEKYPAAKIMVMTPLHRRGEYDSVGGDGGKPEGSPDLLDYVNMIRRVAEYYSLPVLDLYAVSGMQPAVDVIRERYMPDRLHPNNAGHVILTDLIVRFIETTF